MPMTDSTPPLRVTLGKTGIKVSPICFGTWQLSPRFWGKVPEQSIIDAIHHGFSLGVNFFDTADAYGEGLSERVVGRALADLPRDQVILATKVYHHWYDDGRRHGDLSRDYILAECDASLKRLKLDHIDLYQCHSFDQLADPAETADALDTLVRQGKIRAYGTSNWTTEQMRLGREFGRYDSCQPGYSLINRRAESDVLPYCRAQNIGVLVYSSLHKGLLTGKYRGDESFDDLRKNSPDFTGERFKMICDRMQEVGRMAREYGMSTVQLVLAVTIMHPAITCAIVGIKNREQIEDAVGAMGRQISRDHWYRVRDLLSV
jgi:aryl-alcohol dehydrogenase-like predicted oxidoreductase